MQRTQRPLNEIEKKIIDVQYLYFTKKVLEGFKWKQGAFMVVAIIVLIALIVTLGASWASVLFLVVFVVALYSQIKTFFSDRKRYRENKELFGELKTSDTVNVIECRVSRALYFPTYEDEGSYYLFEISERQLLCYYQHYDEAYLFPPSEHFRFYADEKIRGALGTGLEFLGNRIVPIVISGEIKFDLYDELGFPGHLKVIDLSIEEFLDKAKESLLPK